MDTRKVAQHFAEHMIEHRDRLAGKADDVQRAGQALTVTGRKILDHNETHRQAAETATGGWSGRSADGFDTRARRVTASLAATGTAAAQSAAIVASTGQALEGGH
ncbi:MAG: hypothetical protein M3548_20590, partial [Actinomycetota bacterium]|nr:hypothetical protein [Actinomycetota bacterium]